jgi:hypothetical protein
MKQSSFHAAMYFERHLRFFFVVIIAWVLFSMGCTNKIIELLL